MPGRHLAAGRVRADAVGQGSAEFLYMPGVVGEQHVPLEHLRAGARVVLQPVDGQGHALRGEQEQLLAPQVPLGLVDGGPEPGVVQVNGLPALGHRYPGTVSRQPAKLPFQVPADRTWRGELALEPGIVYRPRPLDYHERVMARRCGHFHGGAQPGDLGRLVGRGDRREVHGQHHLVIKIHKRCYRRFPEKTPPQRLTRQRCRSSSECPRGWPAGEALSAGRRRGGQRSSGP